MLKFEELYIGLRVCLWMEPMEITDIGVNVGKSFRFEDNGKWVRLKRIDLKKIKQYSCNIFLFDWDFVGKEMDIYYENPLHQLEYKFKKQYEE